MYDNVIYLWNLSVPSTNLLLTCWLRDSGVTCDKPMGLLDSRKQWVRFIMVMVQKTTNHFFLSYVIFPAAFQETMNENVLNM